MMSKLEASEVGMEPTESVLIQRVHKPKVNPTCSQLRDNNEKYLYEHKTHQRNWNKQFHKPMQAYLSNSGETESKLDYAE